MRRQGSADLNLRILASLKFSASWISSLQAQLIEATLMPRCGKWADDMKESPCSSVMISGAFFMTLKSEASINLKEA
jgi:hypothetical protein